ncbi:ribosomal protein L39 [Acrasis kona]|uniref:Ribosomal protein L39 n=1 Tax=Acrasis kona TaxID=1008807 RepID=A0AAW2YR87_9EUKA
MGANKTLSIKLRYAKKIRQNRPIPYWIRFRTDNKIRFNMLTTHVDTTPREDTGEEPSSSSKFED